MLSDSITTVRGMSFGAIPLWRKGDAVTLSFRGQTYEGIVTHADTTGYSVRIDTRPRILGMPVEIDPHMPENEIRFKVD